MSTKLTQALAPFDNQKCHNNIPLPLKPCNYAIVGRKGTGKTNLLLNLICKPESPWFKQFNLIFLIYPTAMNDKKLYPLIKDIGDEQYYETLSDDVLKDILEQIDNHPKRNKKSFNCLIIYDDVIHEVKKCKMLDRFITQNRHLCITNVILVQKWNSYLKPIVRSNLDLISFFRTENNKELESFADEIGNPEVIEKLYHYATEDPYSFLHVNMYSQPIRYYKRFDPIAFKRK